MDYKIFPVVFPECPIEQVHERPLLAEAAVWAESPAKTQRSRVPSTDDAATNQKAGGGASPRPRPSPGQKTSSKGANPPEGLGTATDSMVAGKAIATQQNKDKSKGEEKKKPWLTQE